MTKRKLNYKKIVVFIIALVLVFTILFKVSKVFEKKETTKNIIDEIDGYVLEDTKISYYKNLFNDLKVVLNKKEVEQEEYAKIITKLFLTDFFTLKHSLNKNDVGGVQYVYADYRNDFIQMAKHSIYDNVENNFYNDRKQELPEVKNIKIIQVIEDEVEYLDKKYDNSFIVKANIEYVKDMGYQKEATVILIKNGNKLQIAEMKEK